MNIAQPIFLWALAGLSIPVVIHLLSRKEGQVIRMGSLRHLRETSTQQFRGIKLNEILLLALRSLLIILFVLLLSGLYWNNGNKKWVVMERGLELHPTAKKLADSLQNQGFEPHWLQPGFPDQETNSKKSEFNYWEVISSLAQKDLQQAVVMLYGNLENFKGVRTKVNEKIQWITFPKEPIHFTVEAIQLNNDQLAIRKGHSQADYTSFETIKSSSPPDTIQVRPITNLKITIVADPTQVREKQIIKASLTAIEKTLPIRLIVSELSSNEKEAEADWIFWLSEKKTKANSTAHLIFYQPQPSHQLLEQIGLHIYRINQSLTAESARKYHLPLQLASLLIDEREKWNRIQDHDRRVIADNVLLGGTTSATNVTDDVLPPVNRWLLVLFLLVLVAERLISYQRNQ